MKRPLSNYGLCLGICCQAVRRITKKLRIRQKLQFGTPLPLTRMPVLRSPSVHSFSSLSYDRSKASSKASCPHSAIYSFLLQMTVSSPFLKVIQ